MTATLLAAATFALALLGGAAATAAEPPTSNSPVVSLLPTRSGGGYWQVASDGGVFTSGDAQFYGSLGGARLNARIVAAARTPSGAGYWLVGADGGVFALGDAVFHGSLGAAKPAAPIVGIAPTPSGGGYWLTGADGGIFAFGDARFFNSLPGLGVRVSNVVGITRTPTGGGYWLTGADGGVFAFGDARYSGRVVYTPPAAPQSSTSAQLAAQLRTSRATFQSVHASGVRDNAHAAQNIIDTADGRAATRSSYDADGARGLPKAPGGVVELRPSMLKGLLAIATTTSVRVSELAGGQHNANSVHYAGIAFDIDQINGAVPTTKNAEPLLSSCRASGASLAQVERPGLSGAHVHCEWRS